jgi:hypothetical protein
MKLNWKTEELEVLFRFTPEELNLIHQKRRDNRIRFAILLKIFQIKGYFPDVDFTPPKRLINFVADQLQLSKNYKPYSPVGAIKTDRAEIRLLYGFREVTTDDYDEMAALLAKNLSHTDTPTSAKEKVIHQFKTMKIELPGNYRVERIASSGINLFETEFYKSVSSQISTDVTTQIDRFIQPRLDSEDNDIIQLHKIKSDPGRLGAKTIFKEIEKLKQVRELNIPFDFFKDISQAALQKYYLRVVTEDIRELRRHPDERRHTLLAIFFWLTQRKITDNLVELLIQTIYKIGFRAEKKIEKELLKDFKKVSGKTNILFRMAKLVLDQPDGTIKDVIFPEIGEKTLIALVKEYKNTGAAYRSKVYTKTRSSYAISYRKMFHLILNILEFHSNNMEHRPVIEALELIKKYIDSKVQDYPLDERVPVDGIIPKNLQEFVVEYTNDGQMKVNRINYEICVLRALREKLRCKEIWVAGADRYRNPDEDLPEDFEQKREDYYSVLNHPTAADHFIAALKEDMYQSLWRLNQEIPDNPTVRISKKKKGWITVTPLEEQPPPKNIIPLKAEILSRWPMTDLLDVLKEADLRIGFTDQFKSIGVRDVLDKATLQKRLILALFGLGTNTGLKRISAANNQEISFKDLLYIRRKFIHKDNLRNAIAEVVNAILKARNPDIWGDGTTSCAADAKKFGSWDQNLMTEWHIRYRGRGVMIYWHVDKKSACIYSQLKTCSSSEVAAMIEGLLRHCTDAEIKQSYTDTHGQSEIAFAFCHLLGFNLMPRIKSIYKQKLYLPETNIAHQFDNLQDILTRSINWELIAQQYDQMIKYATAIRLGTAETDAILKRFT